MNYESETYRDLQKLTAGNLYLSIIIKAKASMNLDEPITVFELLGGNHDIYNLKDLYKNQGFFSEETTGLQLMEVLDESYRKLCIPYVSKTIFEEQEIKKYELIKPYYMNRILSSEMEYATFFQGNIIDYLNKIISPCIESKMKSYQKIIK